MTMLLDTKRDGVLVGAWYGPVDVLGKVLQHFECKGHLLIESSISFNRWFGDPSIGCPKTLRLSFSDGQHHELPEVRHGPGFYRCWSPPVPAGPCIVYILFFDIMSLRKSYERFGQCPWSMPMYVPTTSLFENHAICQAHVLQVRDKWADRRCVGFISYRADEKVPDIISRIKSLIEEHDWTACPAQSLYQSQDVPISFGDRYAATHPGLLAAWQRHVIPRLGATPFHTWFSRICIVSENGLDTSNMGRCGMLSRRQIPTPSY